MGNTSRDTWIESVEQYKHNYPNESRAVMMIVQHCNGSTLSYYYQGNEDSELIGRDICSYVYINGWRVISICEITIE